MNITNISIDTSIRDRLIGRTRDFGSRNAGSSPAPVTILMDELFRKN